MKSGKGEQDFAMMVSKKDEPIEEIKDKTIEEPTTETTIEDNN